jgi:hypothetical protein
MTRNFIKDIVNIILMSYGTTYEAAFSMDFNNILLKDG